MAKVSKFHNQIAALALIAALILSLAPTVSRISEPLPLAGWADMCTTEGLQRLPDQEVSALIGGLTGKLKQLEGSCDLCPLLSALVFTALWMAFLAVANRSASVLFVSFRAMPASLIYLTGLGSRGPPMAFRTV